ncbi:hypothetical protein Agub_g13067 [Astrephomene gubernaculifera]|uniref:Uncharacterized protein n=1 Tax=Astrephomene gubernaculifera TaxID=47775 RepID=A0AAD3E1K9_9CHLO|nr:hypothetical protein Agub_g13067 [Astrephomene gubernaculifera]
MSEEVRTNKRRRSESEEPEEEAGDGSGVDAVGAGVPAPETLDAGVVQRIPDNTTGEEHGDGSDQAAADAAAAAVEQPKLTAMPAAPLPVQMAHVPHVQPRVEERQPIENYYKTEQSAIDANEYAKVGGTIGGMGISAAGMTAAGMTAAGMTAAGMTAAGLGGLPGMGGSFGQSLVLGVDLNQQILAAQQRQYEMVKAQMNSNAAAAAAAAAARAAPKPPAVTGRKSAPSAYEPPVQLTASGRPARARRVNYAELAGAMDDEEEDDQSNLVPNWARRRRKTADQDRDYGVGVGSSRGGGVQASNAGANAAMYGMAGAGGYNAAPRAAAPAAGVNLYGLAGQGAAGLRNAVGGAAGGLQAANLAANALAGQAGWQGQVMWNQAQGMGGPYGALQSLAAAQARPQVAAAQQYLLQPGAARGVAPNIMQDMQLMLGRGADGQGGVPGAGQQR